MDVANAARTVADLESSSTNQRADAWRAIWQAESRSGELDDTIEPIIKAAIHTERRLAVAKSQHAVAIAKQKLFLASESDRAAASKQLKKERASVEKAKAQVDAQVKATDRPAEFVGAKWSATRFLNSTRDDPVVTFPTKSTGRRTALARWITDRRNPLPARVAANHIWMRHFGQSLVSNPFDFGRNAESPTTEKLALLDYLAGELIDSGWSMKHLHRLIVQSTAYRMSSSAANAESNLAIDPDNRLMWRRESIRVESQVVRDSILSLAGTLDQTIGGPPVLANDQASSKRRSLYFYHSNNDRNLFLTTFDEARVTDCYRREQTIVPQQALALSNSDLVLR
ncbi:MAG: DUF1553 domain-containing protein, partial [Pirellulaceae bacterium]|nr:DUF1553 domain-containing protein [Pirellulaceae bacterium]